MVDERIGLVMIGVKRSVAIAATAKSLEGSRFYIAAALDIAEAPKDLAFSAHNLAVVLYSLYPRPRALLTGTAVDQALLDAVQPVWEDHVKRVGEPTHWVQLWKTHPTTGPPPPGIGEVTLKQLEEGFKQS